MSYTTEDWLDYIKRIRERNNELWMQILKIALEKAPDKTRDILQEIRLNDMMVSEATGKIADEDI